MMSILAKGVQAIGTRILMSLLSEKMLEWCFWRVAKLIVASTKTEQDDEFLAKLEEVYGK